MLLVKLLFPNKAHLKEIGRGVIGVAESEEDEQLHCLWYSLLLL